MSEPRVEHFNLDLLQTLPDQQSFLSGSGSALPFEVIIMAGGKGERLHPLTEKLPKPLLPVGGKPIVSYTLQRLKKAGIKHFSFCLNYLGEKICQEFGDGKDEHISISYIFEKEPLGTVGGAKLKEKFHFEDILVINGDLLTTIDFDRFYGHYLDKDADLCIASIPYRINLPYGILEVDEEQALQTLQEKPTFTYHINSGIYLLKKPVLDLIPEGTPFDAIDLIRKSMEQGLKVVSYPLLNYWIDIGKMEDYEKAQEDIRFLDL